MKSQGQPGSKGHAVVEASFHVAGIAGEGLSVETVPEVKTLSGGPVG